MADINEINIKMETETCDGTTTEATQVSTPFLKSVNYNAQDFDNQPATCIGREMQQDYESNQDTESVLYKLLFSAPFFELMNNNADEFNKMARCSSCNVVVRGFGNNTSNFINHMERLHPQMAKLYNTLKRSLSAAQGTSPSVSSDHAEIDLSTRTLERMNEMFNKKLQTLVTRDELNAAKQDLANSVEQLSKRKATTVSTLPKKTINDLQNRVSSLEQECKNLRSALERESIGKKILQREISWLGKEVRQRSVVIRNITVGTNQKIKDAVDELFRTKLNLNNINITRIAPTRFQNKNPNRKNVFVDFATIKDANLVFGSCKNLKNTDTVILPRLSSYERRRRSKLMTLRKELLRRNETLKVSVNGADIIIDGKRFYWDDLEGLSYDNTQENFEELPLDAAQVIKNTTNLDMTEFINILKNYNLH